ncbi:MAG: methyltransferase domain-containing protein [bacterium]
MIDMKSNFIKKQSQYWDTYTKYIDTIDLINIPLAEKIELEFLVKLLGNPKGKKILDLGCGTGKFGLKLAKMSNKVIGVDISENSIKIANKTAKKYNIKTFDGIVDDFKKTKYKNYFDYILAINLIHHTNDAAVILKNINKALKKGGVFIVFEINPFNLLYIPFLIYYGQIKSHLTKEYLRSNIFSLEKLLEKNKFKILEVHKWCLLPTKFYNYSLKIKSLNEVLNKIPIIKFFSAFHIILCKKAKTLEGHLSDLKT